MINKKKIVVLGGGIGSLSSIFAITSMPDWQQKYDITLYQLGWRLGGKGASGRNAELGQRIEEHGLHVWFGFYDNAFRTIQQCYAELDRPKDAPLATWDQAFKPHDYTAIQEYHHETWKTWSMIFLPRSGTPGIGGREYTPIRYVQDILYWLWKYLLPHLKLRDCAAFLAIIPHAIQTLSSKSITQLSASEQSSPLIALKSALDELYKVVLDMFERTSDNNDVLRRTYIISILWLTAVRGIISDGIIFNGFDVIDDLEFREWLKKHGAPDSVAYSAPIQSFYDLALAYEQGITEGNPSREGNIAAGTALHSFLLVLFAYKGSLMWKMQASMGDVVFTPLYEVLKARGVKFEFFHKVTDLIPNEQGTAIQQIIINKQVSLKNPDQEYQPLVDVKGLPCWPSEPLYEQLVEGEQVQAGQHNLESHWTAWQDAEPNISLNQGVDFDLVICGIPIAALKLISEQLATKSQSWQNMVDNVKTVRSLAMQTWLTKDLKQLGWQHPSVVLDAYIQPFNTWADMGQTISYEAWSASLEPSDIAYFCGTMPDDVEEEPPTSDAEYPISQTQEIKQQGIQWLNDNVFRLWPNVAQQGQFDWDTLLDPENRQGEQRFDAQYWQANVYPSERYTLSLAGTNKYRLTPDGSDFHNLYLAGDWVDNGFLNVGCIEATVISGLQAAEAITGTSFDIVK